MFFHLGQNAVVRTDEIIGIFDLDITSRSHLTREFLTKSENRGEIINAAADLPRSFVLVKEQKGSRVYLSQLSAATLSKRSETTAAD